MKADIICVHVLINICTGIMRWFSLKHVLLLILLNLLSNKSELRKAWYFLPDDEKARTTNRLRSKSSLDTNAHIKKKYESHAP